MTKFMKQNLHMAVGSKISNIFKLKSEIYQSIPLCINILIFTSLILCVRCMNAYIAF